MLGQGRDLVGAANGRRDLAHAREVARAKSGAYTVWRPLQLGAVAAGAGPETLAALERYGRAVGEAFALRDDILGVLGDPVPTGKPVGDDLIGGQADRPAGAGDPAVQPVVAPCAGSGRQRPRHRGEGARPADRTRALRGDRRRGDHDRATQVATAFRALDDPAIDPAAAEGLAALARRVAWRTT